MTAIISASNISKRYANHLALDNISVDIPTNSIFGLLGPNGAGKTSLIRIINQITGPDKGTILFNGEPLNEKHIAQIGYLPEERGLYKKMKVGEQALYLAQLKGMSKKEAKLKLKYWFDKFEIGPWWNKRVEELSKGMQQKVQFIVTVLHQPKLLILDEPFSGFDPINTNLIKAELLALKAQGTTILFSTHNMESVEELCDNIMILNKSTAIIEGAVKDIQEQFKSNTYKIEFKGTIMGFTNALWTEGKLIEHNTNQGITTAIVKITAGTNSNQLVQSILPAVELISYSELIPSMNAVFLQSINEQAHE